MAKINDNNLFSNQTVFWSIPFIKKPFFWKFFLFGRPFFAAGKNICKNFPKPLANCKFLWYHIVTKSRAPNTKEVNNMLIIGICIITVGTGALAALAIALGLDK